MNILGYAKTFNFWMNLVFVPALLLVSVALGFSSDQDTITRMIMIVMVSIGLATVSLGYGLVMTLLDRFLPEKKPAPEVS